MMKTSSSVTCASERARCRSQRWVVGAGPDPEACMHLSGCSEMPRKAMCERPHACTFKPHSLHACMRMPGGAWVLMGSGMLWVLMGTGMLRVLMGSGML
eukprot:364253-Chlamydomonas_euryale.AAC.3